MTSAELGEIVTDAFSNLISSFGLHYVTTEVHASECWSTFYNETTGVTVHYELGSLPWVELTELKRHGSQIVERNRVALEFLFQERHKKHRCQAAAAMLMRSV